MISFFKQFVKEGDLAIDVGANIGDTTVLIALCTGPTGLTIGFDPNPFPFKILEKNASLNQGKLNIVPVNCAITPQDEEFYLVSSEASFSNAGISKSRDSKHGKFVYPHMIKGVNLQGFLEENHQAWLPKFSFIKVDAEGYDKEIIKSIRGLISKYKPIVIAESFGESSDEDKMELYEVIANLGYKISCFEDFDIRARIHHLNDKHEMTRWKKTINIYATPN
jgi:FkbM family methyltransferase